MLKVVLDDQECQKMMKVPTQTLDPWSTNYPINASVKIPSKNAPGKKMIFKRQLFPQVLKND